MTAFVPAYIKTSYKNDPTFKNSKVVYSIYENCFTETLNAELHKKAVMNGMTAEDTKVFESANCNILHIWSYKLTPMLLFLQVKWINADVLKFVKDSNKPTLAYNLTENFDNFYTLYEEISNEEMVSIA